MTSLFLIERNDRIGGFFRLMAADATEIWRSQIIPAWLAIQADCRQVAFAFLAPRPTMPALPGAQTAAAPRPVRAAGRDAGMVRDVHVVNARRFWKTC